MDKFRTDKKCVDFLQIDNLTDNLPDPIKPTVSKTKSNDIFECPQKPDSKQTVSFTLVDLLDQTASAPEIFTCKSDQINQLPGDSWLGSNLIHV